MDPKEARRKLNARPDLKKVAKFLNDAIIAERTEPAVTAYRNVAKFIADEIGIHPWELGELIKRS